MSASYELEGVGPVYDAPGAFVGVVTPAAAGDVSGMEIEVGGGGIFVFVIHVDSSAGAGVGFYMSIDSVSQFDQAVSDVTPMARMGTGALLSVVRTGQDSGGVIPTSGGFHFQAKQMQIPNPFFIPAGMFLTLRRLTVNSIATASVGFYELPA